MSDLYDMLKAIEARDPDGGSVEPTDAMYEAHKQWAIQAFGRDVWDRYRQGGWGEDYSESPSLYIHLHYCDG